MIADTNVVSEFMKDTPDPHVLAWAYTLDPTELTISVVTVEEIDRGLGRLPTGRRRKDLERRWARLLDTFAESIAIYDLAAARATARILIDGLDHGRPMSLPDAQIAGISLTQTAALATRNVRDFAYVSGLALINPFDNPPLVRRPEPAVAPAASGGLAERKRPAGRPTRC